MTVSSGGTRPPRSFVAEPVLSSRSEIGESPIWDELRAELLWVDTMRGMIARLQPATGRVQSEAVGQPIGSIALTVGGQILAAVRDGFGVFDWEHGFRLIRAVEEEQHDTRMNDGACDPAGRFWAGTMEFEAAPGRGSLYRLNADLTVERMLVGVSCSNGIGWSPDGGSMYYIDSPLRRVDVFAFDTSEGHISDRRVLAEIDPSAGVPDGLAVDEEGFVWVALWGGGSVHRYAPDGYLDAVVTVPTPIPTSCAFGGDNLDKLFITTASIGLEDLGGAGGIFRVDTGARGLTVPRFAGL